MHVSIRNLRRGLHTNTKAKIRRHKEQSKKEFVVKCGRNRDRQKLEISFLISGTIVIRSEGWTLVYLCIGVQIGVKQQCGWI